MLTSCHRKRDREGAGGGGGGGVGGGGMESNDQYKKRQVSLSLVTSSVQQGLKTEDAWKGLQGKLEFRSDRPNNAHFKV